jgi:hypothetical protein
MQNHDPKEPATSAASLARCSVMRAMRSRRAKTTALRSCSPSTKPSRSNAGAVVGMGRAGRIGAAVLIARPVKNSRRSISMRRPTRQGPPRNQGKLPNRRSPDMRGEVQNWSRNIDRFGNGGGRGKGGQDRGGGAGRKTRQKIAPVDLHAPALSCPVAVVIPPRITFADSCQGACVSPVGAYASAADASSASMRPRSPLSGSPKIPMGMPEAGLAMQGGAVERGEMQHRAILAPKA